MKAFRVNKSIIKSIYLINNLSSLSSCSIRCSGNILPLRRSDRANGHGQPDGHQHVPRTRVPTLARVVLLRTCAAGQLQGGLAGEQREQGRGSGGLHCPREGEWRGCFCKTIVKKIIEPICAQWQQLQQQITMETNKPFVYFACLVSPWLSV